MIVSRTGHVQHCAHHHQNDGTHQDGTEGEGIKRKVSGEMFRQHLQHNQQVVLLEHSLQRSMFAKLMCTVLAMLHDAVDLEATWRGGREVYKHSFVVNMIVKEVKDLRPLTLLEEMAQFVWRARVRRTQSERERVASVDVGHVVQELVHHHRSRKVGGAGHQLQLQQAILSVDPVQWIIRVLDGQTLTEAADRGHHVRLHCGREGGVGIEH